MEHIILSHTAKHLAANKIIIDEQHGFREKLSCETQLIQATQDWSEVLNRGGQTDVLLLDFSKAFDKVPHKRLSLKLSHYGIRGKTLGWIQGFSIGQSAERSSERHAVKMEPSSIRCSARLGLRTHPLSRVYKRHSYWCEIYPEAFRRW